MERFWKFLLAVKGSIAAFHKKKRRMLRSYLTMLTLLAFSTLMYSFWASFPEEVPITELSYTDFIAKVRNNEMVEVRPSDWVFQAKLKDGTYVKTYIGTEFAKNLMIPEMEKHGIKIDFSVVPTSPDIVQKRQYIFYGIMATCALWIYFFFWGIGQKGEIRLKFWRMWVKKKRDNVEKTTFADVAGIDEVKAELQELVDFLTNPMKYASHGGKMPRGTLLIGAPGVGKTLVARAVAGEAGVPFHAMKGSEFIEMYVGVGASRIRTVFEKAKADAPCIVFIDEVESVAAKRGAGAVSGGEREHQQTTNELLAQLDGFEQNDGIHFIATSNNPQNLDEAFTRPGRIDNVIIVPKPDAKGREQILKVHTKKMPLANDVSLTEIALGTPGFSGAELANIANFASQAARRENAGKDVAMRHFLIAKDKVMMGDERKSMILTFEDKLLIARHETGHAVVALRTPGTDPVEKISARPRTRGSLGVMIQLPTADRIHHKQSFFTGRLAVMMGGRAAEKVFYGGDVSAGASSDIEEATKLASAMVCNLGMSEAIGPVAIKSSSGSQYVNSDGGSYNCSPETAARADQEIKRLNQEALDKATAIIEKEKEAVERIAQELVQRTELSGKEIQFLLDGKELSPKEANPPVPDVHEKKE